MWAFYSYFVSPTGFRWRALFGDTNYPAGYELHGIDISPYQGTIDCDPLRARTNAPILKEPSSGTSCATAISRASRCAS